MSNMKFFGLIVLLLIVGGVFSSIYWVDEWEKDIVFKFGKIVRHDDSPGLHVKVPVIEKVSYYDGRIQTMDSAPELFLTLEKKNLVIDAFIKWRIKDVFKYYTSVGGSTNRAMERLSQLVNDGLRAEVGKRTVKEVVSGDRAKIMDIVQKLTDQEAAAYGIKVVDVRLKRVDYDPEVSESVYRRMEAERLKVATERRATGEAEARKIRAEADAQKEVMLAGAFRKAETVRGEGDKKATEVYGKAYGEDEQFYKLYRSLNAYKNAFNGKKDLLILEPDNEFFRYFKNANPGNP